ncbi:MAG: hypothetical protein Q8P41_00355 [Pseudomonadota bacterium]|nr:hypothetical protein [Pseudomonadota bacterium]
MWSLLLLACSAPTPEPPRDEDTAVSETGVEATDDTAPTGPTIPAPSLTAAGVGDALAEALAWQIPTFPPLARSFAALMAQGDSRCTPDAEAFEILTPGGCRAESGVVYSGAGGGVGRWEEAVYSYQIRADLVIIDTGGNPFEVGGDTQATVTVVDGGVTFSQELLGSFHYLPAGLWLGEGTSGSAWIEATFGDDGTILAELDGGYDLGGAAVYFDDLAVGGTCGDSPTGAIRLRDDAGYWYVLTFSSACDTCGEVVYADEVSLGEACVDPTVAMAAMAADLAAYMHEHPPVTE